MDISLLPALFDSGSLFIPGFSLPPLIGGLTTNSSPGGKYLYRYVAWTVMGFVGNSPVPDDHFHIAHPFTGLQFR
jgi:hypothetical protein